MKVPWPFGVAPRGEASSLCRAKALRLPLTSSLAVVERRRGRHRQPGTADTRTSRRKAGPRAMAYARPCSLLVRSDVAVRRGPNRPPLNPLVSGPGFWLRSILTCEYTRFGSCFRARFVPALAPCSLACAWTGCICSGPESAGALRRSAWPVHELPADGRRLGARAGHRAPEDEEPQLRLPARTRDRNNRPPRAHPLHDSDAGAGRRRGSTTRTCPGSCGVPEVCMACELQR
jgi:hypothetical protein